MSVSHSSTTIYYLVNFKDASCVIDTRIAAALFAIVSWVRVNIGALKVSDRQGPSGEVGRLLLKVSDKDGFYFHEYG